MSIWDELMGRLKDTGDAIKTEATRRAAKATMDQLKNRVSAAADEMLDGMEEDLDNAKAAREGRTTYTPSEADPIADQIIAQSRQRSGTAEPTASEDAPMSFAEQKAARRARAQAELAALKKKMAQQDSDSE